jgi:hypothetical protein
VLEVGGGLTVGPHLSAGEKKRKREERVAGPVDWFGGPHRVRWADFRWRVLHTPATLSQ